MQKSEPITIIQDASNIAGGLGRGKIEEIIRYVDAKYVDAIDKDQLVEDAIGRILENLDPHSAYISAEYLSTVNEQLDGNFDGIGVEFLIVEDTLVVVTPLEGGPAATAGVLPGDKIVSVSDTLLAGTSMKTNKIMTMLRGKNGTPVNIGIIRGKETALRHFKIIRDKIPINSLDVAYKIDEQTVYAKISRFSAKTYTEFLDALEKLAKEGDDLNLIIDLRNNNGGYLQQATNILNQIIPERNKLLVYTEGRTVKRTEYQTTGPVYYDFKDVCILINEGSASASEILAGVIQDYDRGTIIGRRSFGKGLVQEQYRMSDGSALRLTVARYYTPSGRSIQRPYDDLIAYDEEVADRFERGELYQEDSIVGIDTTVFYTTNGRPVYGGQGISPDIFTPLDSIYVNEEFLHLNALVPEFGFRYIEENRSAFDMNFETFNQSFAIDSNIFDQFLDFANEKGFSYPNLSEKAKAKLRLNLKARISKHIFQDEGFYRVLNQEDPMIQQAMEEINGN